MSYSWVVQKIPLIKANMWYRNYLSSMYINTYICVYIYFCRCREETRDVEVPTERVGLSNPIWTRGGEIVT